MVRPAVAVIATARTSLTRNERIFTGSVDPRGIVAASTAATFTAPLVALHIGGAGKLLAATFLVIVGTVAIYGLSATPSPASSASANPNRTKALRNNPAEPTQG